MIPIYRAKSNERKNTFVEGFLIGIDEETGLCTIRTKDDYIGGEICYLHTLSIHFEDMLDSQGNKIFASLQEDGKGGDVLNSGYGEVIIAIYEEGMIKFRYEEVLPYNHTTIDKIEDENFLSFYEVWQIRDKLESEVIGIQE
ncbi:hypothetical protein N5T66_04055 [Aliarcobacter cryaerophilus]|uniref:hypothetical protein n=1 Tax=Aliarcobacter cryaerophilus TaxID=28198 RepID=UPI0021B3814C|nr:hypothetical protein [Aliarcobacter cryaerophilus]MCT7432444.1 hypothetical protein [Aliarcobacter cryaerophilus]